MLSNAPILDLPQELIIRISSYLTTIKLGHFRRSCKHIERYLFKSFAKEFFTKRQFLLEHESLEALVGIANHPGLASSLKDVIIDTRTFLRYAKSYSFLDNRRQHGYLSRNELLCRGQTLTMLSDAFIKLPELRSVGIRDFDGHGRIRDGLDARWRPWGWTLSEENTRAILEQPGDTDYILPLITLALARARTYPTNLEVLFRGGMSLNRDAFNIKDPVETADVLRGFKTVMLTIGGLVESAEPSDIPKALTEYKTLYLAPIMAFIGSLEALEHLRLNFDARFPHNPMANGLLTWLGERTCDKSPFGSAIPTIDFKALNTLEIGSVSISSKLLKNVLIRFNLKSFALWKVTLLTESEPTDTTAHPWATFLADLSKQLPQPSSIHRILIGYVSLSNLYRSMEYRVSWRKHEEAGDDSNESQVEYVSQKSGETAQMWLLRASHLTTVVFKRRYVVMDGGDDDDDDDEDEDDENDDTDDMDLDDDLEEEDDGADYGDDSDVNVP